MSKRSKRSAGVVAKPIKAEQKARHQTYLKALWAENLAALYFFCCGYRIEARRWRCALGEIDLILRRRNILVFVEVKLRKTMEAALSSISHQQQARILRAAQIYVSGQKNSDPLTLRADAFCCAPWRWPVHIENAFTQKTKRNGAGF